jgi:uncharacterized protein YaaQ
VQPVTVIVPGRGADRGVDVLVRAGFGTTRINTAGGFRRRGHATLLIGVEDTAVPDVLHLLRDTCGAPTLDPDGTRTTGVAFVLPVGASWQF